MMELYGSLFVSLIGDIHSLPVRARGAGGGAVSPQRWWDAAPRSQSIPPARWVSPPLFGHPRGIPG